MAYLDQATAAAVLKTQYTQSKVWDMIYPDHPTFAMMKKNTKFVGENKVVAFKYGAPQGRGAAFGVAQGNITPSQYKKVIVERKPGYAFAQIAGETIEAAATDAGALLRTLKTEIDGAMYTAGRALGMALFGNGGGARGQISATSNVATPTITLANVSDSVKFEVGMVINLSANDGTTGAKRTGTVTLTKVDRNTGTLTASANWNTITGATAGDYIFQNGDIETTNTQPTGILGWIPRTDPTTGDDFFGLDRSVDPQRLAGVRYLDGAGGPIETTLIDLAARICANGGKPNISTLNPLDYANLVKALGSKVIYDRVKSVDMPDIGFESVKLWGPKGPIQVIADIDQPQGWTNMLQTDTWSVDSLGAAPRILDLDSNQLLRVTNSDSYEIRIGYYAQFTCEAPGFNGTAQL